MDEKVLLQQFKNEQLQVLVIAVTDRSSNPDDMAFVYHLDSSTKRVLVGRNRKHVKPMFVSYKQVGYYTYSFEYNNKSYYFDM